MTYLSAYDRFSRVLGPWLDWSAPFPERSKVWIDEKPYRELCAATLMYRLALGLPMDIPPGHAICLRTIRVLSRASRL